MYITKLVLHGCKRLMLSNIQHFEYTPSKNLQMMIGSNGSGKSSVLAELGPVPSHHSNYTKDGYKEFGCQHNNQVYLLRSDYTGGSGKHSFRVTNGNTTEELNQGGTYAIQKELVVEHFGLTQDIFDVLIGVTRFTDMTTAKRREWLTRLSPVDLGYAFNVYNSAKTAHRDHLGAVKLSAKRMANENQDLPDDAEVNQYRRRIDHLTDKINRLMELRQSGITKPFRDQDDLSRQLQTKIQTARQLLVRHPVAPEGYVFQNPEDLQARLDLERGQYRSEAAVMDRMFDEHQQLLQNAPARDEMLSDDDIRALKEQVAALTQERERLANAHQGYVGVFPLVDLPLDHSPTETLNQVFRLWSELVESFPNNPDNRFSQDKGTRCRKSHEERKAYLRQQDSRLNIVANRLSTLRGCSTVVCPECDHDFKPGVDPKEVVQLESERDALHAHIQEQQALLAEETTYLEDFEHYLSFVRAWRHLTQEYPVMRSTWDYCTEHRVMFVQPKQYTGELTTWYRGMEVLIGLRRTERDLDVLQHKLRYVEAIDRDTLSQHDQRRLVLEREIQSAEESLARQLAVVQRLETYQQEMTRYLDQLTQTQDALQSILDSTTVQRDALFQESVATETRHAQMQLAQTHEQLSKIEMREAVLRDLEQEHERAKQAHGDYGLLVKALAPTEGLIGRYIMNFMHGVVRMLNTVIAEIWTYPMEVLPSQVDKEELDYRFPLNINNGALTPKDISMGSSSQRDMINFAFRLLAMKFLKLEDMPLYLDEFGSTFDEQHRENLIPFINQMLEMGQVQQLFYISHFGAVHGAFNQAEFCVLDPTNITVPQEYNQHVVLA